MPAGALVDAFKNFNSQPREGGWYSFQDVQANLIDFNSQPREGGWSLRVLNRIAYSDFNSQPREGGWPDSCAALR